jgi:hypothetical protein
MLTNNMLSVFPTALSNTQQSSLKILLGDLMI